MQYFLNVYVANPRDLCEWITFRPEDPRNSWLSYQASIQGLHVSVAFLTSSENDYVILNERLVWTSKTKRGEDSFKEQEDNYKNTSTASQIRWKDKCLKQREFSPHRVLMHITDKYFKHFVVLIFNIMHVSN